MKETKWASMKVYELLRRIDEGYTPDADEAAMLAARDTLDLIRTPITALPESLGQLKSLQTLRLWRTPITALPESLGQLTGLQTLILENTQITALPESLGQLTALQYLDLSRTPITALPASLGQLTALQDLALSGTQITALPDWLGVLPVLRKLDLSGLTLRELPCSLALRGLPFVDKEAFYMYDTGVNLRGVTLTEQDISVFLNTPELIPGLYLEEEKIPLRECRVLFLGDGDSGKTYTIRRIQNNCRKETRLKRYRTKETPGVEIADHHVDRGADSFDIHFWDFGGQEILHAMHRCFLTDKTCYVVTVKSRETKGTNRARYWLRNIRAFAPNSPVLLYVNCWDDDDGRRCIDESKLRDDFKDLKIVDVVYVSAKRAEEAEFRRKLLDRIERMASESYGCKQEINYRWLAVREAIREESRATHYLTKERYDALCRENGIPEEQAPALLELFNILGVCFSYHWDENRVALADYRLLNPIWLTNAVYAVIEEGMAYAQSGKIKFDSVRQMLGNRGPRELTKRDPSGQERTKPYRRTMPKIVYSKEECRYVIDVAANRTLCYKVDENTLFFPALCTNNTPKTALGAQAGFPSCAVYRFRYDYLPDSLLHRMMISCLKKGFAVRETWLQGMILEDPDAHRAIIRMTGDETLSVEIWHKDERPAWELFPMLRAEILEAGRTLNMSVRSEWIADGEDEFQVIALLQSHRNGQKVVYGNAPGKAYPVYELLTRFYDSWAVQNLQISEGRLETRPYRYHACKKEKPALRRAVWEAYEKKCVYCGKTLMQNEIQIDHVLAVRRKKTDDPQTRLYLAVLKNRGFHEEAPGYPDYLENYLLSCGDCNRKKSNEVWSAASLRFYHELALQHTEEIIRLMERYEQGLRWDPAAEEEDPADASAQAAPL